MIKAFELFEKVAEELHFKHPTFSEMVHKNVLVNKEWFLTVYKDRIAND